MTSDFPALQGRRLLVADANAARREAIAGMLNGIGAVAELASTLHQALDILEASEFDGVILGERLGDGDGTVLARAIRTSPALFELRLVIVSSAAPPEGIDAACAWPVSPEELAVAFTETASRREEETSDAPVLDLAELESIAGGMTIELVGMLKRFAGQAEHLATEAMTAATDHDSEAAQGRAHALKGAAFSAGAMRLGRAARSFETAVAKSDWDTAARVDLVGEAQALAQAIEALPEPAA